MVIYIITIIIISVIIISIMFTIHFIKNLIFKNLSLRYEEKPTYIREYTIYDKNKDKIINFLSQINKISQFDDDILKPIFSKGSNRLFQLINLINDDIFYNLQKNNFKLFFIAQFIILNQVFGDANHRMSIYILKIYSTYTQKEIDFVMNFTERIHCYKGDLHHVNLWKVYGELMYPNIEKIFDNKEVSLLLTK